MASNQKGVDPHFLDTLYIKSRHTPCHCCDCKYFPNESEASDHNPHHMLEVFKNPQRYLGGPNGDLREGEKNFTIVGAGISGLTLALLLVKLGHQVRSPPQSSNSWYPLAVAYYH